MAVEDVAVQVAMTRSGRADLAVSVWGDTGTPILALHPGVGDSRIWRWCAPAWAAAGHGVVAYDRRGFGETRYEEEPHDDIADLLAVTSATGASPAVVVANSRGGGLALDLALAHPDHVAGLVLIAPSPSGVVVGEHDLPGIRRLCRELVAALPAAELATIADSAHCPAFDHPDELSLIVLELMASLPPAA